MPRVAYLIADETELKSTEYARTVKRFLRESGIIDEEDEDGWLAGPRSLDVVITKTRPHDAFESCEIHSSRSAELLPMEPAVHPTCPKCRAKMEEQFYDAVNEHEGAKLLKIRVTCPKCASQWRLTELKDRIGIHAANRFVCFNDLQGKLDPKWLARFSKKVGVKHQLFEYFFT